MKEFRTSIDIAAPAERAWQVMSDIDRWHEWTPSVRSITRIGGAPLAAGTRVVIRQPKFPPALWRMDAVEPGRSFTWVSRAPGMTVTAIHSVLPLPTGSRATLTLRYDGVLGPFFARMTERITERYLALEATGLKARSEDATYRHAGAP